jgi:hypothetical protein
MMKERQVTDLVAMLKEFRTKFDLPETSFEARPMLEREDMMYEELCEYNKAVLRNNPEGALDALVDLVYFAIGTAAGMGWDFNEAFKRVHEANMKKVRAYTERSAVDLVKPPGWKAPDLSDLVKE